MSDFLCNLDLSKETLLSQLPENEKNWALSTDEKKFNILIDKLSDLETAFNDIKKEIRILYLKTENIRSGRFL